MNAVRDPINKVKQQQSNNILLLLLLYSFTGIRKSLCMFVEKNVLVTCV